MELKTVREAMELAGSVSVTEGPQVVVRMDGGALVVTQPSEARELGAMVAVAAAGRVRRINARFWEYVNDGWVKLTLRPEQTLRHVQGGRDEEGWSVRAEAWEYDGRSVVGVYSSDGTDCDGRMQSEESYLAWVCELKARPPVDAGPGLVAIPVARPEWRRCHCRQRDFTAEAAGY
jgi:hypothetical protein